MELRVLQSQGVGAGIDYRYYSKIGFPSNREAQVITYVTFRVPDYKNT